MGIKQRLTGVLLFTLVFLTGCSLFVISVIWIRQFLLLAGINIISIVVVTTAFLINFAAGSSIFGRLSDKLSNQTNLVFVLMVLVSLYSFMFSSAFSLSELIARGFSLKINNDLFGASVFPVCSDTCILYTIYLYRRHIPGFKQAYNKAC